MGAYPIRRRQIRSGVAGPASLPRLNRVLASRRFLSSAKRLRLLALRAISRTATLWADVRVAPSGVSHFYGADSSPLSYYRSAGGSAGAMGHDSFSGSALALRDGDRCGLGLRRGAPVRTGGMH